MESVQPNPSAVAWEAGAVDERSSRIYDALRRWAALESRQAVNPQSLQEDADYIESHQAEGLEAWAKLYNKFNP